MSPYTEDEKKEALHEQNRIINESDLDAVEFRHTRIPFYLFLIVTGLILLGIGFLIHS